MTQVRIKFTDPSQEAEALQRIAEDIAKVLTPTEEILYIALQSKTAPAIKKAAAVATSNRFIKYKPGLLGGLAFHDFQWQDVKDCKIKQGILGTDFDVETMNGHGALVQHLDKEQAKRLYGICQQLEQEWREKRRVRDMEEARARAGGMVMAPSQGSAPAAEDPVAKLAKAKAMLDQKLISEAEYESIKAKILGSM